MSTRSSPGAGLLPAKNMSDHVPKPKLPFDTLAEQRIREAQAAGEFDNLPGFGRPIPGIDEPHDELWWVKDKLKREQLSLLPLPWRFGWTCSGRWSGSRH
jgi:hypothetical protein